MVNGTEVAPLGVDLAILTGWLVVCWPWPRAPSAGSRRPGHALPIRLVTGIATMPRVDHMSARPDHTAMRDEHLSLRTNSPAAARIG